jgi:hypothetical protein
MPALIPTDSGADNEKTSLSACFKNKNNNKTAKEITPQFTVSPLKSLLVKRPFLFRVMSIATSFSLSISILTYHF